MDYKSIGRNIRKCRESKGLTREAFAEMTELSVSYMSAIERGEKLPKLDTFIRIANMLQVSSDLLLSDVLIVGAQIEASDLSRRLSALPIREQKKVLHVMQTMMKDAE